MKCNDHNTTESTDNRESKNLREDEIFELLRGKGQPILFVYLAVQIAASPNELRDLILYTAFGVDPPKPLPSPPPQPELLSMYRRHRRMQNALAIADGITDDPKATEMLDTFREASRMNKEEVAAEIAQCSEEELIAFMTPFAGMPFPPEVATLRVLLQELDAESRCSGDDEESLIDAALESSEGQYFLRVWWPCWFLYREYPPRLLRAARQGDIDALDRLLRLDKFIVGDPGVARRMGEYFTSGTPGQRKQLAAALEGRPKKRLTDKAIRSGLGALISQIAFLFRTTVTAPQIEELFNRIERVRTGRLRDPAVPTTETWAKAVRRQRNWPSLPTDPDSNLSF
jgi:hypothetical protein